jgi:endonuclease G
MKLIFVILLFLTNTLVSFSQDKSLINNLEIPELKKNEYVVKHEGYSLSYNELNEQANWVAYQLTDIETIAKVKRENKFIIDPFIKTESANNSDYLKSGYDRGHLAPAGDMAWSEKAMEESFYYSNMSPQNPSFNRGIWKKLEEQLRNWATDYHSIYIITGPVLDSNLEMIGPNKVSVPKYYYKVILNYTDSVIKGIGFIIPNLSSTLPLQHFAVTIDSVEKITNINFFPVLDDEKENAVEHHLNMTDWNWNATQKLHPQNLDEENIDNNVSPNQQQTHSTQCNALTKKGTRCRKMTKNKNGKCNLHE